MQLVHLLFEWMVSYPRTFSMIVTTSKLPFLISYAHDMVGSLLHLMTNAWNSKCTMLSALGGKMGISERVVAFKDFR